MPNTRGQEGITHLDGKAFVIDEFKQLRRYLILGSDQPTHYANAKSITNLNIEAVKDSLDSDYIEAINTIINISENALAPSNEPALVALAIAASHTDVRVRRMALENLERVARTGTHLFHFMGYLTQMRSTGSVVQKALSRWYLNKSPMSLVNQITKYQQRDGWSHKDLVNIAHVKGRTPFQQEILRYITYGDNEITTNDQVAGYLAAIKETHSTDNKAEVIRLIETYKLPREVLPTSALKDKGVWEVLLPHMGYTAMLRNLATMTRVGLVDPLSGGELMLLDKIRDNKALFNGKIHPIDIIKAKLTYDSGHGQRGTNTWTPNKNVSTALEAAFYESFGTIQPTNKRGIIALDVSGSMGTGNVAGVEGFSPYYAAAVMAMVTLHSEKQTEVLAFAGSGQHTWRTGVAGTSKRWNRMDGIEPLDLRATDSLEQVMGKIRAISNLYTGTNCELPMRYAMAHNLNADYFIVYTDSETDGEPNAYLQEYRKTSGIADAKMITVGMVSSEFSLCDPNDPNALDVVGFDSSTPAVMSEFIRGNI